MAKYKNFTVDFHARAWVQVEVTAASIEEAIKKGQEMKLCDKITCGKGVEFVDYNYVFIGAQQTGLFGTEIEED